MKPQEASPSVLLDLQNTIKEIGLARFVGRINSGVVEPEAGYHAVDCYVATESKRPLLSKLTHIILGRKDTYDPV